MEVLRIFLQIAIALSAFGLLFGLWKPHLALWWLPVQYRMLVIRYYGPALLLSALVYWLVF